MFERLILLLEVLFSSLPFAIR